MGMNGKITRMVFFIVLLSISICWGQTPLQETVGSFGVIDWPGMRISATGIGVPPPDLQNTSQARAMAQRAAEVAARRNLLEVVKAVDIDSYTRTIDRITQQDLTETRVKGELQFSTIDNVRHFPDGTVEVVASMPLTGRMGEMLIQPAARTQSTPDVGAPITELMQRIQYLENRVKTLEDSLNDKLARLEKKISAAEKPPPPVSLTPKPSSVVYTGLIIDATKTEFSPCLKPSVYAQSHMIYPNPYMDHGKAAREGYVRYFDTIENAQKSHRAGSLPLVVEAVGVYMGDCGLEIDANQLETINAVLEKPDNFIFSGNVLIVFRAGK